MFDQGRRADDQRAQTVAALRKRLDDVAGSLEGTSRAAPGVVIGSDVLAAPDPLSRLLPGGGLPRGGSVSVQASTHAGGSGATSLLVSLLSAPRGVWIAVVGMPGLGLAAVAELGIDLDRLVVIPDPGPDALQVLSVLADGVDLIATAPPATLPPARLRVFSGRLRQRGAVLLVAGRWPGADLMLTVRDVRWRGLGSGHGRLRDRDLDVEVAGRRLGTPRSTTLTLRAASPMSVAVGAVSSGATSSVSPVLDVPEFGMPEFGMPVLAELMADAV
jgi:hypothetical protein